MGKQEERNEFFKTIEKSEDDFEKKITQISAGALALSITFIDKIVDIPNAKYFWILILGWILLALTLSINLISILVSRKLNMRTLNEIDIETDREVIYENIKKRNTTIRNLDLISLIKLLLGIFLIVLFSSININNKKQINMDNKDRIEKGRTISQIQPRTPDTQTPNTGNSSENTNQNQTGSTENKE